MIHVKGVSTPSSHRDTFPQIFFRPCCTVGVNSHKSDEQLNKRGDILSFFLPFKTKHVRGVSMSAVALKAHTCSWITDNLFM